MRRTLKKLTIWNSHIVDEYERLVNDEDFMAEHPDYTDDAVWEEAAENINIWHQDERMSLDKQTQGSIIIVGTLGLWNGPAACCKNLGTTNLKDILQHYANGDYIHFYSDGVDLCADEVHHDGTNHYIFRELKDGIDFSYFESKIYSVKADRLKQSWITYGSKSLLPYVNKVYGWGR